MRELRSESGSPGNRWTSGADLAYPSVLPQCGIPRMKSGRKAGTHQNVRDVSSGAGEPKDAWSVLIAVCVRAMVVAGDKLFVAGPPDMVPNNDPLAAFEGRLGVVLWAFSTHGGEKLAEVETLVASPSTTA